MSKELTEQLRNGTLEDGLYYIGNGKHTTLAQYKIKSFYTFDSNIPKALKENAEVLAKVPTYEEWVKNGTWYTEKSHNELLKKIEELECQLKEANEIIKSREPFGAEYDYFEKWGVE